MRLKAKTTRMSGGRSIERIIDTADGADWSIAKEGRDTVRHFVHSAGTIMDSPRADVTIAVANWPEPTSDVYKHSVGEVFA